MLTEALQKALVIFFAQTASAVHFVQCCIGKKQTERERERAAAAYYKASLTNTTRVYMLQKDSLTSKTRSCEIDKYNRPSRLHTASLIFALP